LIKAKTSFVAMVSASTYYWNSSPSRDGSASVLLGFSYALKHTGSLAFGSFIIALV